MQIKQRYDLLSTKSGFNGGLRHFQLVNDYVQSVADGYNLADILVNDMKKGVIDGEQIMPIVNVLLHDKFQYCYQGFNFLRTIESSDKIHGTLSKWRALQMVLIYHSPGSGLVPINLADETSLKAGLPFVMNEYALLYIDGSMRDRTLLATAVQDVVRVLNGRSVTAKKQYLAAAGAPRRTLPTTVPHRSVAVKTDGASEEAEGGYRVTPKYSVLVTNELFHNGNVEAWKKIIESYNHTFPTNEVLIWYESERIKDINTLFRWGKVKNGTPIIFSIAGTEIAGVAKLQRYLFEGASPRFESFLRGAHNQVLGLF